MKGCRQNLGVVHRIGIAQYGPTERDPIGHQGADTGSVYVRYEAVDNSPGSNARFVPDWSLQSSFMTRNPTGFLVRN